MLTFLSFGLAFSLSNAFCLAANDSVLNDAAQITSQAREFVFTEETGDLNQKERNSYYFNRSMGYLAALSTLQEPGSAQSCYPKRCCLNPCSEKDRGLLEARLALRTHYVGKYRNQGLEETETYCIFPSAKARQVQEQGRQQINKLAQARSSSEHNAVVEDVHWFFKTRVGRWHRYRVGNIAVATWSWPLNIEEDQAIFAICKYAQQCGALALPPFKDQGLQEGWLLIKMPLEQTNWHWVSQSLYLRGKCFGNQCHWEIKSMGLAGPPNTITSDLEWYDPHQRGGCSILRTSTGIQIHPGLKNIQFKLPGKQLWRSFTLAPLILRSHARVMHKNPLVLVWGGCEARTGHCHYYFSHQVNVHAISWGTPERPNCRALTPEELSWINWNDLRL